MWQTTYVKWKNYWATGTSEFSPISTNFEKFAFIVILLKLYFPDDGFLPIFIAIPVLIVWNVAKILVGRWRDHAMLWHYESEFVNERNPTLKRIEKAVGAKAQTDKELKPWPKNV